MGYASNNGRLDSPNMSRLTGTVNLSAGFNYSMSREFIADQELPFYLGVGAHTSTGAIDAKSDTSTLMGSPNVNKCTLLDPKTGGLNSGNLNGSFGKIDTWYERSYDNRTSSTRFAWEVYITSKVPSSGAGGGMFTNWVYIDNFKVSIGDDVKWDALIYRYYFPNHTN